MATSIRLTAKLEHLVARLARQRGQSKSDIIRAALIAFANGDRRQSHPLAPYAAMKHLLGCASGGPPDLSVKTGEKFRSLLRGKPRR
jgi:Ribbon-helix-helix protein, copG family